MPSPGASSSGIEMQPGDRKGNVELNEVVVEFEGRGGAVRAVEQLSLSVPSGQFVAVLGPSGCGKSTLLNVVAGFIEPTRGEALLDGQVIAKPGAERGVVFQQPTLFPWKTVRENVALGPRMAGLPAPDVDRITRHFIDLVGLAPFADQYPDTLSGGMQQRVGIARTLANNPSVLLMDEPFGALDAQTRELMQENLLQIWEKNRTTLVFVTHDIEEAIFLADRVILMSTRPGRIIADIAVDLARPRAASVVDSADFIRLKKQCRELIRTESIKAFAEQEHATA
jgi:NitT/TauT family transport system ATP-binding protein